MFSAKNLWKPIESFNQNALVSLFFREIILLNLEVSSAYTKSKIKTKTNNTYVGTWYLE